MILMRKIKIKSNGLSRSALYIIVFSLISIQFFSSAPLGRAADPVRTDISVNVANDMINNNTVYPDLLILDVRDVGEFNVNHLYNATLIPLSGLESRLNELEPYNDTEIVVYCLSGFRSLQASDILVANNFTKIYNMLGGITTWIDAGYDYWLDEDATSIDFALPIFLVSLIGIVVVLVLFSKRRWKLTTVL